MSKLITSLLLLVFPASNRSTSRTVYLIYPTTSQVPLKPDNCCSLHLSFNVMAYGCVRLYYTPCTPRSVVGPGILNTAQSRVWPGYRPEKYPGLLAGSTRVGPQCKWNKLVQPCSMPQLDCWVRQPWLFFWEKRCPFKENFSPIKKNIYIKDGGREIIVICPY